MGDLIYLNNVTRLDLPAERVIERAKEDNLKTVVIMGYDQDGEECFYSSAADGGTVLWLAERLKKRLLDGCDEDLDE